MAVVGVPLPEQYVVDSNRLLLSIQSQLLLFPLAGPQQVILLFVPLFLLTLVVEAALWKPTKLKVAVSEFV